MAVTSPLLIENIIVDHVGKFFAETVAVITNPCHRIYQRHTLDFVMVYCTGFVPHATALYK